MRLMQSVGPEDHVQGRPDAPVLLVEYLDYGCPYCARAHQIVSQVTAQLGDMVSFVPRHFPLSQIHPDALLAAQAAEAAAAQAEHWAMHRTLLEHRDALDPASLMGYADALGLDVPRFREELRSGAHLPKVREDFRSGVRSGVNGTPTFYVNAVRLDRGWDGPTLAAAIRRATQGEPPSLVR